ncbi:hypothetical protein, partial [Azospirillum sp. B4]|uniref:hypothetical protein n=1 Tax=Azospirillum sp. B4 TaxID=95605 RepID=UPI0035E3CB4D
MAKNALSDLAVQMAGGLDQAAAVQMLGDHQAVLDRLVGRLHRTVNGDPPGAHPALDAPLPP